MHGDRVVVMPRTIALRFEIFKSMMEVAQIKDSLTKTDTVSCIHRLFPASLGMAWCYEDSRSPRLNAICFVGGHRRSVYNKPQSD